MSTKTELMTVYKQKKNRNQLEFSFKKNGLDYRLNDSNLNKKEFIPYERITNNSHEFTERNDTYRNNAIYTAVVAVVFLAINIFYGTRLWAWLFMLTSPTFWFLYKRSIVVFTVLPVSGYLDIYIIRDKLGRRIRNEIYTKRNKYLRSEYGYIDYDTPPEVESDKFDWLHSLGVIGDTELEVVKEEIVKRANA